MFICQRFSISLLYLASLQLYILIINPDTLPLLNRDGSSHNISEKGSFKKLQFQTHTFDRTFQIFASANVPDSSSRKHSLENEALRYESKHGSRLGEILTNVCRETTYKAAAVDQGFINSSYRGPRVPTGLAWTGWLFRHHHGPKAATPSVVGIYGS